MLRAPRQLHLSWTSTAKGTDAQQKHSRSAAMHPQMSQAQAESWQAAPWRTTPAGIQQDWPRVPCGPGAVQGQGGSRAARAAADGDTQDVCLSPERVRGRPK